MADGKRGRHGMSMGDAGQAGSGAVAGSGRGWRRVAVALLVPGMILAGCLGRSSAVETPQPEPRCGVSSRPYAVPPPGPLALPTQAGVMAAPSMPQPAAPGQGGM